MRKDGSVQFVFEINNYKKRLFVFTRLDIVENLDIVMNTELHLGVAHNYYELEEYS